jgi:hypothetical protein
LALGSKAWIEAVLTIDPPAPIRRSAARHSQNIA